MTFAEKNYGTFNPFRFLFDKNDWRTKILENGRLSESCCVYQKSKKNPTQEETFCFEVKNAESCQDPVVLTPKDNFPLI